MERVVLDLGVELAGLEAVVGTGQAIEAFQNKDAYNAIRHKSIFHKTYSNDFFKEALQTYKKNSLKMYTCIIKIYENSYIPKCRSCIGRVSMSGFQRLDQD